MIEKTPQEWIEEQVTKQYAAIGEFVICFSHLEWWIKRLIGEKLDISTRVQDAVITHDFVQCCTLLKTIMRDDCNEYEFKRLNELVKECLDINNYRVRIIHGSWSVGRGHALLAHVPRGKLVAEEHYENIDDVVKSAHRASALTDKLYYWAEDLKERLRSDEET